MNEGRPGSPLYPTGLSGSGKNSLLAVYVVPKLKQDYVVLRLRGDQDPVAAPAFIRGRWVCLA
jgi:hypothetical protein